MNRRGVWALALLSAGLWGGYASPELHPVIAWAAGLGALAVAAACAGRACRVALACAVVCLGVGWFSARTGSVSTDMTWAIEAPPEGMIVHVKGIVAGPARVRPRPTGVLGDLGLQSRFAQPASFDLILLEMENPSTAWRPAGGRCTVRASGAIPDALAPGVIVRLVGHFRPIGPPRNPGQPDPRLWARQEGVAGSIDTSAALIELAPHTGGLDALQARGIGLLWSVRSWAMRALDSVAGPAQDMNGPIDSAGEVDRAGALLRLLLLGQRERRVEEVESAFARMGIVHVLAISGFHLAVLAWGASRLLRLTGERGRLEPILVSAVVLLYVLVVPAEAPVLRCGITLLLFLGLEATGRRYDRLNMLAWVAVLLLLWRPLDLWSPGFQLSFVVVAALLWLSEPARHAIFGSAVRGLAPDAPRGRGIFPRARGLWGRAWDAVREPAQGLVSSSVLCWAIATPIVAYHAGWFSPLGAAVSLVVVPVSAVLLATGYVALVVGMIAPSVAGVLAEPIRLGAQALSDVVFALDQGMGTGTWGAGTAIPLPRVGALWAVGAAAAVAVTFGAWRAPRRVRVGALVLALAWFVVEVSWRGRLPPGTLLRIDTLAVGDGTCHVIRSRGRDAPWWAPDDVLIWDAGSLTMGIGVRELPRAIRWAGGGGVWTAPSIVVSHANVDHFAAAPDLVRPLGVRRVLMTRAFAEYARTRAGEDDQPNAAGRLLDWLERAGLEIRLLAAQDTFALGPSTVRVLWPDAEAPPVSLNDASLVAAIDVVTRAGPRRVLLTGDIEPGAIGEVMERAGPRVDVLEAPHHGSFNERTAELVLRLGPDVVLQSTGARRLGDERWAGPARGRTWYITAADGAAWVEIRDDGTLLSGAVHAPSVLTPARHAP